jgi:hypothetical protein
MNGNETVTVNPLDEFVHFIYPQSEGMKLINVNGNFSRDTFDIKEFTLEDDLGNSIPYYIYYSKNIMNGSFDISSINNRNYFFYGTN